MAKIGLFYGSSTGNTEVVAFMIKDEFEKIAPGLVEVHNIGGAQPAALMQYHYLILGIPTWNTGELQDDWDVFWPNFDAMDMTGKRVAVFGLGDQNGYGYNFLDGAGMLADKVMSRGADLFGLWVINGRYQFEDSKARIEDYLLSLGVDQDGQPEMTPGRVTEWVAMVKQEFAL